MSKITIPLRAFSRYTTEAALGAGITKGVMMTVGKGVIGTVTLAAEKVFGSEAANVAVESIVEGIAFTIGMTLYALAHPYVAYGYKSVKSSAKTAFAGALLMIASPAILNASADTTPYHNSCVVTASVGKDHYVHRYTV